MSTFNQLIAEELSVAVTGHEYHHLDTVRDRILIHDLFRKANIVRYLREGINPSRWISTEEIESVRRFV